MPITIHVDREAGFVRIEASGQLTLQDLLDMVDPMLRDPRFEPGMPQLVDLGAVEHTDLRADEMRTLVETYEKQTERVGASRVAVFAPRPLLFGVSRMYESLAERLPGERRVFDDLDEAQAWLREPAADGG